MTQWNKLLTQDSDGVFRYRPSISYNDFFIFLGVGYDKTNAGQNQYDGIFTVSEDIYSNSMVIFWINICDKSICFSLGY